MTEDTQATEILPIYVVVDLSSVDGMGVSSSDQFNKILPSVLDYYKNNPAMGQHAYFGLISAGADTNSVIPLQALKDLPMTIAANSLRNNSLTLEATHEVGYANIWSNLHTEIIDDVARLKADGNAVHRPIVLFFSGGKYSDEEAEWKQEWSNLVTKTDSYKSYPFILPFATNTEAMDKLTEVSFPVTGKRAEMCEPKLTSLSVTPKDIVETVMKASEEYFLTGSQDDDSVSLSECIAQGLADLCEDYLGVGSSEQEYGSDDGGHSQEDLSDSDSIKETVPVYVLLDS